METRKWLFFLHNFIEPNHYAVSECLDAMVSFGIDYDFCCKRILSNPLAEKYNANKKITLEDLPYREAFWKGYEGVHVIYDGKPSLAICALSYIYDVPYVITFHGGYDTNEKIFHEDVKEKTVFLCSHARAVSVVSESDRKALINLSVKKERIVLVPPPINLSRLEGIDTNIGEEKRISVVGRLIPKKGIEYAIKAIALMPNGYQLDIVGDGPLYDSLVSLASELGVSKRVTFHGELSLERTLEIVMRNQFLWHPSIVAEDGNADGIPQIIVYAMALGRIVIATRASHIDDAITPGENGFLCPSNDPRSLAEITMKCSDSASIMKEKARISAKEFGVDKQKEKYRRIYSLKEDLCC